MFHKEQLQLSYYELTQKVVLWVCEHVSARLIDVNQHTRRKLYPPWCLPVPTIFKIVHSKGAQIFKEFSSHHKILGATWVMEEEVPY